MTYKLGKSAVWDEELDVTSGACIFCGKGITHYNDNGPGWLLEAADEEGKMGEYLYCCYPMCPEAEAADRTEIHRCYNETGEKGWKLDPTVPHICLDEFGSYSEFVGDRCPSCGGTPEEVDARLYDPEWAEFFKGA
jgi:hypothetical protein